MAPVWMAISKTLAVSPVKFSIEPARIKWPVDEMGKNSVKPSTMPMRAALINMLRPMVFEWVPLIHRLSHNCTLLYRLCPCIEECYAVDEMVLKFIK